MNEFNNPQFHIVPEDVPLPSPHSCGHYHGRGTECPTDETCRSEQCCILGGVKLAER